MTEDKKRLIVIDSNALIHRAYHALPPLTTKKGELVNAIYGFLLVFFKAIKEFQPDFIAATFDFPAPTFRHQKYKLYKAHREKAPEELYQQIPKVKEILENFNVQIFEKEEFFHGQRVRPIFGNNFFQFVLKLFQPLGVRGGGVCYKATKSQRGQQIFFLADNAPAGASVTGIKAEDNHNLRIYESITNLQISHYSRLV